MNVTRAVGTQCGLVELPLQSVAQPFSFSVLASGRREQRGKGERGRGKAEQGELREGEGGAC